MNAIDPIEGSANVAGFRAPEELNVERAFSRAPLVNVGVEAIGEDARDGLVLASGRYARGLLIAAFTLRSESTSLTAHQTVSGQTWLEPKQRDRPSVSATLANTRGRDRACR